MSIDAIEASRRSDAANELLRQRQQQLNDDLAARAAAQKAVDEDCRQVAKANDEVRKTQDAEKNSDHVFDMTV